MSRILLLGATGRTAAAILTTLPGTVEVTAALRAPGDVGRLADTRAALETVLVDITDTGSLRQAIAGDQVVVNAIRLREEIEPTELAALHDRIVTASAEANGGNPALVVTVGGAGALRLPDGRRFWQDPAFPSRTLPRGRAHAELRDHLEAGSAGERWSYLIPPPAYLLDGAATHRWETLAPSSDESAFTRRSISYADFGAAVAQAVTSETVGTRLIAWPIAPPDARRPSVSG